MSAKQQIKNRMLEIWGGEPQTLDELAQCVIAVINCQSQSRWNPKSSKLVRVAGFQWDVHWSDVSNGHECPINGQTNWEGRDKTAPRSYLGWAGRVWIRYDPGPETFGSDPFRATLTYTGTGGFGGYGGPWERISQARYEAHGHGCSPDFYPEPKIYSWDYRFFAADWPGPGGVIEKQQMWDRLGDKPSQQFHHRFLWEDPEIREKDHEFMRQRHGKTTSKETA